mgnify:CR=1 FL=1
MNTDPKRGPVLIDLDDTAPSNPAEAAPVIDTPVDAKGAAMQQVAALAARKPSRVAKWFWSFLLGLVGFVVSLAAWDYVNALIARSPILGGIATALIAGLMLVLLGLALRELAAFSRLQRLDGIHKKAGDALAHDDLTEARNVYVFDANIANLQREGDASEAALGLQAEVLDADGLLGLAEATVLAPLDARAAREVEAAARQVSALPSRENGGRLGWLPITNYPPQLQQLLLGLSPGEVTQPLPITNGVALFQMRDVREAKTATVPPTAIDYAAFYLDGGQSEVALRAAQELADRSDTCDDLYGAAQGLPETVLERNSLPPSDIAQDIALELARLDTNEASYNLTRNDGQTLVFLMMCGRTNAAGEGVDPEAVRNQLRSQRLGSLATSLLEDLRTAATITTR